jgi:hypothetical protein
MMIRDDRGRFSVDPHIGRLEAAKRRFAAFCEHDPVTGCVLWTGGKTSGMGHSALYGSFWYEGRRWFAHRWAAHFVHGHDIDGLQVEHHCPFVHHPNTLCVEHVWPVTSAQNRALQTLRSRPNSVEQTLEQRRYWLFVQVGIEPPPPAHEPNEREGIPFHLVPEWLRPFAPPPPTGQGCPF